MRCYGGKRRAIVPGVSKVLLVTLRSIIAAVGVGMVATAGSPDRHSVPDQKDNQKNTILIFAPHPDDETLGCAATIMRAVRSGLRIRVVFLTNGDGWPDAAAMLRQKDVKALAPEDFRELARARQKYTLDAARVLGLAEDSLVYLGYPDAGLAQMPMAAGDTPYRSPFTEKNHTYGPMFPDYHSQMHQKPAPYLWTAALGDITELLQAQRPSQIYVTDGAADTHKDHRAAFDLVRAAAAAVDFSGELYTYVNHAGDEWPWPAGPNPVAPFEAHVVDGKRVPDNIAWPPDERRPITHEEAAAKLKAIRAYPLDIRLDKTYFESFVKSEEIFWRKRIRVK
jgi:LmbE family N-acetylglucosaminyl deacetylase